MNQSRDKTTSRARLVEARCAADDSSPAALVGVKSCQDCKSAAGCPADAAPP